MALYEMVQVGNENRVFVKNSSSQFGSKNIGAHFVTFSGCGQFNANDEQTIHQEAKDNDDEFHLVNDVQITVGPKWKGVFQCSPLVAPNNYLNTDADDDDWQGWDVSPCTWELVSSEGALRIRLKFSMGQHGQSTWFRGIAYQVTATGDLAS